MSVIALPSEETTSSLSAHQTQDPFPRPPIKSTGPRTEKGKKTSSQNARKHNLSSTTPPPSLLANPTYQISKTEFHEEFNPQTPAQCVLVDQLTFIAWKLDQIPHLEHQLLATPLGQTTPTDLNAPNPDTPHLPTPSFPTNPADYLFSRLADDNAPPPPKDPTNQITATHLLQNQSTPLTRLWDYHRRLLARFQSLLRQIHQLKRQQQTAQQSRDRTDQRERQAGHDALTQCVDEIRNRNWARDQAERRQRQSELESLNSIPPSPNHPIPQSAPHSSPAQNELPQSEISNPKSKIPLPSSSVSPVLSVVIPPAPAQNELPRRLPLVLILLTLLLPTQKAHGTHSVSEPTPISLIVTPPPSAYDPIRLNAPPNHRRRVVITGIGVVSPNAIGAENFARACIAGKSGISRLQTIDTTGLKSSVAAQILNFDPLTVMDPAELRRVPRMVPLALAASKEALASANLHLEPDDIDTQRQIGCALGTGGGGLAFVEEQYRAFFLENKGSLFSITAGTHGNLSSELSIALRLRGPSHVLSTGCASSTDAIGYAAMLIRSGTIPMMLTGGADAPISRGILTAFEKMRVVSTRNWDDPAHASRPFSADRDGFVLGEGAWMFVLEEMEHAKSRGATIYAEIAGYASTCDAYHRVQIAPHTLEPVRAMELALNEAGATKEEVGYINLHGTATDLNDRMETAAIKKCFGQRAAKIPTSSTKSMIGHPQGACGAAGVAATVLSMRLGELHPTINLINPDPQCDLDYIPNVSRKAKVDVALCNCIAFGSKNSAIVLRSADPISTAASPSRPGHSQSAQSKRSPETTRSPQSPPDAATPIQSPPAC